jgi:hypothetical protein
LSAHPGEGRIVVSTFTHVAPETICMYLDGLAEPIRCTPNHITWSAEHRDFVEAHELQPGHMVLCDDGIRTIARVDRIAEPIRVYNLEIQGQHVYQVSALGMLVHNASPGSIGGDGASAARVVQQQVATKLRALEELDVVAPSVTTIADRVTIIGARANLLARLQAMLGGLN